MFKVFGTFNNSSSGMNYPNTQSGVKQDEESIIVSRDKVPAFKEWLDL